MQHNQLKQEDIVRNQQGTLGCQIARITKLKRQLVDLYIVEMKLSRTQWQALFWIHTLGECTQKELLKSLDVDPGHLARVLDQLEKGQYICRSRVVSNRRCVFIQMTTLGTERALKILNALDREEAVLLNNLNDSDKQHFRQLLSQAENNISLALNKLCNKQGN